MRVPAIHPQPDAEPRRTHLADGRELLYFFDAGEGRDRTGAAPADTRTLPPRPQTPLMRYDPLLAEWVSYAEHRQTRTHLPPASECPLCPSGPERATEIPAREYDVAVFENRFPAFGPGIGGTPDSADADAPAAGRCEVVAFASEHGASFAGLSLDRARTVIRAWVHRTAELSRIPGVAQVFIFENRGAEIGVTLHHPHGQIYAYPFATPRTLRQLESVQAYRAETGGDLFGDLLSRELREGSRVVARGQWWTAYVPYAARMPLEVHVVPHRNVPDLASLTAEEQEELSGLYLDVLRRIEGLYPTPTPYIAAWYQAPVQHPVRDAYRMHLQVTSPRRAESKLKYLAGSEAAMGAFIADVSPEETAARLRRALPLFATRNGGTE
ncbi:galactose-1-phosphate uridylyltransferase [Arthrobacter gandavensis]|uniref:galactose-1-phosphate uridylyltransferase n=1 Tax=Arthrobacter gandavensis TaxID=169960 RepID=UPI0018901872|nr:galactose-1-phosphate uridylyltransferase [Arthrobacter gandavensis]MBF4995059.1 galactose-1-phosphate uridylyltransferase [Arthrobacter gandavensis]